MSAVATLGAMGASAYTAVSDYRGSERDAYLRALGLNADKLYQVEAEQGLFDKHWTYYPREIGIDPLQWLNLPKDARDAAKKRIEAGLPALDVQRGIDDALAAAAAELLKEQGWNKRQEIARGQVPYELDPANPSSPLSYDRLKKWGDWTEEAADDPDDPWNPDNPNGVWGDLAKDALTNDDLKRINDADDAQFWKDLGRELPPGIYRIPQPPPPDNDWNAPFQPLASGTYTIQTSTSYERLNFDGSSGGTQNSTGNDVVSGQLIGFRYETGPTFARVYARLQSGTSVTEDLVGGVAFAPGAGRSPKVSVTSVASNGTPIQPQPKPQPRQEPQPLPAPPTSPAETPARSPAPTPTPRANPSPTQQPQATPALTLNPQPPAADAPERFPGFTPSGLPIAPIGSPSGLPGTGSSTGGSPNPGLRPNLNTTPTPRPSFGPKSTPLRFSNSNPFRNPKQNPAPSTGGGSGPGTGGGEIPTTCRYREDELATVRVQKVQVALNGRQRVEQDLSVHEKFTDFASLHFQQMADIKAGVDRLEKKSRWAFVMQVIDTASSLHNAAMLSVNVGQTLGDVASTVSTAAGRFIGLLDNDDVIDINEIVGKNLDEFLQETLGEQTWNGTKDTFKRLNRIITAGANIVWTVRSMQDTAQQIAEWTAENTGRIGNALKRFGVVGEKAYPWMAERVTAQTIWQQKIERVRNGLENLDDAAGSIGSVAGDVLDLSEQGQQLIESWQEFNRSISEATPKPATENQPNKAAADAAKVASAGQDVSDSDLERSDNATT